ncbi:MAG: peptidoglycan DD-metalloendopeptidase family protein [Eudoraea sp.]|nr:peptidoglycan DD-metalloendopeptidase family protein [Eudoraea sp.]MBT8294538.1 peptidoglycan DD-metalloendopeptidase family protein [Eudoraea sp.]
MTLFEKVLLNHTEGSRTVVNREIPIGKYIHIDLSVFNKDLENLDISNPSVCQEYIDKIVNYDPHAVAYGGYLERRNLYVKSPGFVGKGEEARNIHLGIDFWAKAGTNVIAPLGGAVHSFKNNAISGDYGPTIILRHKLNGIQFYTLYGHLSIDSLHEIHKNKEFQAGEVLATLGDTKINVNYAPHLHFQIIRDMDGFMGDYPGVCSQKDLARYQKNCPDPNLLLKITSPFIG